MQIGVRGANQRYRFRAAHRKSSNEWTASERAPLNRQKGGRLESCGHQTRYRVRDACVGCEVRARLRGLTHG